MPQFTPSSRDAVKAESDELSWVFSVKPCGPGLIIIESTKWRDGVIGLNGLMENHGWYLDKIIPATDESDNIYVIMPVTEAAE